MFHPEDIQVRLREKPFRPLRIRISEGNHLDVYHPDLVLVGIRELMIGFPKPRNPTVYDRVTRMALENVVALEDIPPSASADIRQH
jgi:hypothetical protein